MKFLVFYLAFGFVLMAGAEKVDAVPGDHYVVLEDGKNYVFNEEGNLVPAGVVVLGEPALKGACLAGKSFNQKKAGYDVDKQDFYYTISNNSYGPIVVSITTADKRGLFCATPFRVLESGECLKVYEDNRLQSLASIRGVNEEIICGGAGFGKKALCTAGGGNSYEITDVMNSTDSPAGSYNIAFPPASNRTDCRVL